MNLTKTLSELGKPACYYPSLARIFGVKASIFIAYFAAWTGSQHDADGWIYKSQKELLEELGINYEAQVSARRTLKKFGVLEEKYDRLRHVMYYRVKTETLDKVWEDSRRRIPESGNLGFGNPGTSVSTNPGTSVSTNNSTNQYLTTTTTTTATTPGIDDVALPSATGASPLDPSSPSASENLRVAQDSKINSALNDFQEAYRLWYGRSYPVENNILQLAQQFKKKHENEFKLLNKVIFLAWLHTQETGPKPKSSFDKAFFSRKCSTISGGIKYYQSVMAELTEHYQDPCDIPWDTVIQNLEEVKKYDYTPRWSKPSKFKQVDNKHALS